MKFIEIHKNKYCIYSQFFNDFAFTISFSLSAAGAKANSCYERTWYKFRDSQRRINKM